MGGGGDRAASCHLSAHKSADFYKTLNKSPHRHEGTSCRLIEISNDTSAGLSVLLHAVVEEEAGGQETICSLTLS